MSDFTNIYTYRVDCSNVYKKIYGYHANIDDGGDLVICIKKGLTTEQVVVPAGTWSDLTVKDA